MSLTNRYKLPYINNAYNYSICQYPCVSIGEKTIICYDDRLKFALRNHDGVLLLFFFCVKKE